MIAMAPGWCGLVPLVSTLAYGSTGVYHWLRSGRVAFSAGVGSIAEGDPGGSEETPDRPVSEAARAEAVVGVAAGFPPGLDADRFGAGRGGGAGRGERGVACHPVTVRAAGPAAAVPAVRRMPADRARWAG